eukprot:TRINITY_DN12507_c0_g1_i2.p2 TRINITY_DN12507_c0_g1~~TRINITY_DN12507_c0_g1_i2.p2  ORF type:complete len:542 (+),score=135.10 TRINITY_DN12507_c0_g1_i2:1551-3176(+)
MPAVPKIPPLEIDVWYFIHLAWVHVRALWGYVWDQAAELLGKGLFVKNSLKARFQGKEAPKIVIIGAGFGGICAGIFLDLVGLPYVILERYENLGGVWWENTYPGCACDVMSFMYSFSFDVNPPWGWSRTFATQAEIQKYLAWIAQKYNVVSRMKFNQNVVSADWDEKTSSWQIKTQQGDTFVADILISAIGGLSYPYTPDFPGMKDTNVKVFHSGQWDHQYDLHGKRVAIIGTGASAVQIVPNVQKIASKLYVFQRTPNWILEKNDVPYSELMKSLCQSAWFVRLYRWSLYWYYELRWLSFSGKLGNWLSLVVIRNLLILFYEKHVKNVELRKKLVPNYRLGCKRILPSNEFLPAIVQPNVEVVCGGFQGFTKNGLLCDEKEYEVDCVILSTGYVHPDWPFPFDVRGKGGLHVNDAWKGKPQAYLGISLPSFPNLFCLLGPNTGLGHNSIVFMMECQMRYIIQLIAHTFNKGKKVCEVKESAFKHFYAYAYKRLKDTTFASECKSWYKNKEGIVVTNWYGGTVEYYVETRTPKFSDYNFK